MCVSWRYTTTKVSWLSFELNGTFEKTGAYAVWRIFLSSDEALSHLNGACIYRRQDEGHLPFCYWIELAQHSTRHYLQVNPTIHKEYIGLTSLEAVRYVTCLHWNVNRGFRIKIAINFTSREYLIRLL